MEKLNVLSFKMLLLLSVFPLIQMPDANSGSLSGTNALAIRIEEIKAVDKSLLNVSERKLLRAELYAIKRSLNKHAIDRGNIIYFSAAFVIGIILLIILI